MSGASAVAEERESLREDNRRLILEKQELTAKNGELDTKLRELNKKLDLYEEQLSWFKNKLYGRGTEQLTDAERLQIRLFDEIEQAADNDPPEDQAPEDEPAPGSGGRRGAYAYWQPPAAQTAAAGAAAGREAHRPARAGQAV